ncbi:MAG: hypothetical protein LUH22_06625 [Bacteroides sp.]|nr:hypothetical protein [Bacteroides sp.]
MKTYYFLSYSLVTTLWLMLSSCSSSNEKNHPIIGKWKCAQSQGWKTVPDDRPGRVYIKEWNRVITEEWKYLVAFNQGRAGSYTNKRVNQTVDCN